MRETPVGEEVVGGPEPKGSNKVDVRDALGHDAPDHGFLSKALLKEGFAYTSTDGNVGKGVQAGSFLSNLHGLIKSCIGE